MLKCKFIKQKVKLDKIQDIHCYQLTGNTKTFQFNCNTVGWATGRTFSLKKILGYLAENVSWVKKDRK